MDEKQKSGKGRRRLIRTVTVVAVLLLVFILSFRFSPWPAAMMIRYVFYNEAIKVNDSLERHTPDNIFALKDQQYLPHDKDAFLDVYYPPGIEGTSKVLPVIIWIHGGGLISGNKEQVSNYCKILSANGYTVVAIDYSVAPEKKYPVPVRQANAALNYLVKNATRLHADTAQFFMAGDSGGSLIAAQVANIISNPGYASILKITPSINRSQLKGLVLYCGIYGAKHIDLEGSFGGFMRTVLWSYSGTKDFLNDEYFKTVSVIDYLNSNFPPSYISAGNTDPLLPQSKALTKKLIDLGVKTDTLFFPANYKPEQAHESQFNLSGEEGKLALNRSLLFLQSCLNRR